MWDLGSQNCPKKQTPNFYPKSQTEMLQVKLTKVSVFYPSTTCTHTRLTFPSMESEKSLLYDIVLLHLPGSLEPFFMAVTPFCPKPCSHTGWAPAATLDQPAPMQPPCHHWSQEPAASAYPDTHGKAGLLRKEPAGSCALFCPSPTPVRIILVLFPNIK